MADFYVDINGRVTSGTSKKKKKTDYSVSADGKVTYNNTQRVSDDDIGPVRSTIGTQKDSYFQKSSLINDKSTLKDYKLANKATGADVAEDATKGFLGLLERTWDGIVQYSAHNAYATAQSYNTLNDPRLSKANAKMYETAKKQAAEYVEKDVIKEEEIARKIITQPFQEKHGINVEEASYLGSKGDALVQSATDQLVRSGLSFIPVVGTGLSYGVTGLSVLGGEAENAYQNGANYEEALLSGLTSASGEMASEAIFGGIKLGGKTASEAFVKNIAQKAPNKFLGTLAKWGFNTAGEGLEEVISGYITALGQNLTYMEEKEIKELFSKEDAWESFVAGSILGGMFDGARVVGMNAKGIDYVTEINKDEQKVIDAVHKKLVEERQTDGKKLSNHEKDSLYKDVERAIERGYIDIETIEEVLGGNSYKAYIDAVNQEDSLRKEYEELGNTKQATLAQQSRFAELDKQIKELDKTSPKTNLKAQMSSEVYDRVKNTRLLESYKNAERRTQKLEVDINSYKNESARKTAENFLATGRNNSNETHDYLDMLTRVSEDRDHVFEFVTSAQLEESRNNGNPYGIDEDVNVEDIEAFIQKKQKKIVINMDANKSLNSLVGHELSHSLEQAKAYDKMQKALFKYAETKGEYKDRLASVERRYSSKDVNYELTADLLGDYIMGDTDFVNKLVTEDPSTARTVWNEIKYLLKMATTGSKEYRQLLDVQRKVERAWRESTNTEGDVQFSIRKEAPPKETGVAYKVFYVKDGKLYPPMVANPDGADTPMGVWLNADVGTAAPPSKTGRAQVKAGGKGTQGGSGSLAFRPGWHLGDLPRASQFDRVNPETGNKELFPENFVWAEVEYAKDVDYQEEAMSYGYTDNGAFRHSYAGLPRLPENGYYRYRTNPRPDTVPWVITGAMKVNRLLSDAEVNEILEKNGVPAVHRQGGDVELDKFGFNKDGSVKYSISDSDGNQLTKEQQNFFKDSKVRDENGNLMVVYHGSKDHGFTVFDTEKSGDNMSLFFTNSEDMANSYVNDKSKLYKTYLNIKNPYVVDAKGHKWNQIRLGENQDAITGKVERYVDLAMRYDAEIDFSTVSESLGSLTDSTEYFLNDEAENLYEDETSIFSDDEKEELLSLAREIDEAYDTWDEEAHLDEDGEPMTMPVYLLDHKLSTKYTTRQIAKIAKENGNDGVIIENVYDNGKFSSDTGIHAFGNVYIAFNSNQVKEVGNQSPTSDSDIRYSLREDSKGRSLTAGQKAYFKNSKVVDENGRLKTMFHGTPNGNFNVFKDGTYFTEIKDYADRYQSPSASSISTGKIATAPKTFEVYLNIKKPFDISDSEARDIYINEYIKGGNAMGINPYLSDAEYNKITSIDWTEGEDLREFLIDNGYDYDGLVLDEGADGGYGEDVSYRGKSYVIFSPEQVKDVDNLNPTSDSDIRYSLKENNIKDIVTGYSSGETFYTMTYMQNGNVVGSIEYGEFEGEPNVKMIEVEPAYRRKGIGTKLLQELQKKYPNTEINFGMSTPDGTKLLEKATYTVEDKEIADKFKRLAEVQNKLAEYDATYEKFYNDEIELPENYAPDYEDLQAEEYDLKNELRWKKSTKTFVKTDTNSDDVRLRLADDSKYASKSREAFPIRMKDLAPTSEMEVAPTQEGTEIAPPTQIAEDYGPLTEDEAITRDDAQIADHYFLDDIAPEPEELYNGEFADHVKPADPLYEKDIWEVGKDRSQKAYMYENPEVKPFFQEEARYMLGELDNSQKGERFYNDQLYYDTNGEAGFFGTQRHTSEDIAYLLDTFKYTYKDIAKGLNAIIEDNGKENNAISKRIEFLLDERLRRGYTDFWFGDKVPPNQDYINLMNEKQITSYSDEAWNQWLRSLTDDDIKQYFSGVQSEDIAPPTDYIPAVAESKPTEIQDAPIKTTAEKLTEKQINLQSELDNVTSMREEARKKRQEKIDSLQATYDALKNKDTKKATALQLRIEKQKRLASDIDATYAKRIDTIKNRQDRLAKEQQKDHSNKDRLERAYARIDSELKDKKAKLAKTFDEKRKALASELANESSFISRRASELYDEIGNIRKGVRASKDLGYLLDMGFGWNDIKQSLLRVAHSPTKTMDKTSACEMACREVIDGDYMDKQTELDSLDAELESEMATLEDEAEAKRDEARIATQRRVKMQELTDFVKSLIGDTSTWVDKKLGLQYSTNTLRRNMRDIVRDEHGNPDIAKADAITDEFEGKYDHNEALLKKESAHIKKIFRDAKITKAEDKYIQMLGEFRHNPSTTLTEDTVNEFYEKNKNHIDTAKVDRLIDEARKTYDSLLERLNEVLREQGMREIPYRQGYFPHFTDEKQTFLAKLFNWKTINTEIPTSIAGLTEDFNPNRSWQAFNKQRQTDVTDYSFTKGLDNYVHGALDWIYHMEDIQKRRALENYIRYAHSKEGAQKEIEQLIELDMFDAEQMQEKIDAILQKANTPLNNFVTNLRKGTNNLAGKKDLMDRGIESELNRKFYSTMTNLSNRVTANQVAGSVSSALTNFIPITQSWAEVSPVRSAQAMHQTLMSYIQDDGIIAKSDFLTNRLVVEEQLYKTFWDKTNKGVTFLMTAVDNFTSQTVWRSKYIDNINNGMSENEAVRNADEFAKSVMGGRSRGNMPTIFNAKNPFIKVLTSFQLEVNNQYGYMLKDLPQNLKNEGKNKLVGGYAKMFIGAYVYNVLYSALTGRDSAFDPIGIVEDLLRDLGGFGEEDEEKPVDTIMNLAKNVTDELPFVGGLLGGGRIPIASAMPYGEGIATMFTEALKDIESGDYKNLGKELLNPVYYLAMPMGGGQIRKSVQGLGMFDDDLPIAGSYTDSGNLRFPVEDTPKNRLQAGLFGQYASQNARDYFDQGRTPLQEKQIQELVDLDLPIRDYWEYRDGLKKQETLEDKFDYVAGLDVTADQKNIMINNVVNRKEKVDISNYDEFADYEEFDFYSKNTEKYNFLEENGISYTEYKADEDTKKMYDEDYEWYKKNPEKVTVSKAITSDYMKYREYYRAIGDIDAKDASGKTVSGLKKERVTSYIFGLNGLDEGQKLIFYRTQYDSKEDRAKYDGRIFEYINGRNDLSYSEKVTILKELDFVVNSDGTVEW